MTSSGTSTFNLSTSGVLLEAFDRIGVRPESITREQLSSGIRSLNLELQSYNNNPVNLWKVELVPITLVQGTATYALDASVQMVTDAYVTLVQSGNPPIDRILIPISRDEYATYPNKTQQGPQSVYWFQRLEAPQITVWPVPDGQSETTLNVYVMKRVEDATTTGAQTLDIPIRYLDVVCARLAVRLAVKYAQGMYPLLKSIADEVYKESFYEDQERSALIITPDFGIYQI